MKKGEKEGSVSARVVIHGFNEQQPVSGRLVRAGVAGRCFFLSENGTLYTTGQTKSFQVVEGPNIATYLGESETKALRRLGVLTSQQIKEAKAAAKNLRETRRRASAIADLKSAARRLGIPLPSVNPKS